MTSDDNIREILRIQANTDRAADAARQAAADQLIADQNAAELAWDERTQAVTELCGRFATWASRKSIPYNSPSERLAPGWLLGERLGLPGFKQPYSQDAVPSGESKVSLLVRGSGIVGELVTDSVFKRGKRHHHLRSRPAEAGDYTVASIEKSIADFAHRHNTPWN